MQSDLRIELWDVFLRVGVPYAAKVGYWDSRMWSKDMSKEHLKLIKEHNLNALDNGCC